jgi:two-component system chemotaxis sensor kinase CheA
MMEQMLLALDVEAADDETLHAIFHWAHSVKAGAATFGFSDVAELTHQMETLLDKLRRQELAPKPQMVDLLLAAGDSLRSLLARHQGSDEAAPETSGLLRDIRALCAGDAGAATRVHPIANEPISAPATPRLLELTAGELVDVSPADILFDLFNEIADLGQIEALDAGCAADGGARRRDAGSRGL